MRLDPHTNPRPWFPTILAGVGMTLLLLTATASRAADNAAPRAVATILPLHSLLTVVMDGVSTPELLIPPAQSPHAVRLRPSQATSLDRADLIVWVGPNLESGLSKSIRVHGADTRVLTLVSEPSLRPLAARTGGAWEGHHDHHGEHEGGHEGEHEHEHEHGTGHDSDEGKEHAHEGDHHDDHADQERGDGDHHHAEGAQDEAVSGEQIDPHPWLSPDRSAAIARAMASALSEIDPAHAPRYRSNTDALLARLMALDEALKQRLKPVRGHPYLVFHDAYQYFENHYGLNAVGSVTIDPDHSPGARRIAELRERIKDTGARCVFAEPQFEPRVLRVIREGTGIRSGQLDPLGAGLRPGPDAYFTLMEQLADNLITCLGH